LTSLFTTVQSHIQTYNMLHLHFFKCYIVPITHF